MSRLDVRDIVGMYLQYLGWLLTLAALSLLVVALLPVPLTADERVELGLGVVLGVLLMMVPGLATIWVGRWLAGTPKS